MPRKASFDVESFEIQIIETILHSPVAMSRRAIFDKCRFDNDSRAMLSCFDRLIKKSHFQLLIVSIGDKKNRAYISKNPPKPIEPTTPRPLSSPKQPLVLSPSASEQDTNATEKKVPLHRPKPPEPTFEVQVVDDAADVIPALNALSDVSGNDKLAALGVDKRSSVPSRTSRAMGIDWGGVPVQQIILACGSLVCDFQIDKILRSLVAVSDPDKVGSFAPFRAFFANHPIIAHNTLNVCEPLIALDIPPRRLLETRLAVRMLQFQAGIVGDDSLKASVVQYLQQTPYKARTAIIATLIPLLHVLRGRLGAESVNFDAYCGMLPSLAYTQAKGLCFQEVTPAYEVLGDGSISMMPDLSLLTESEKHLRSNGSTLLTVQFSSKPNMYQLLPTLRDVPLYPVVILPDELVFNTDNQMPERAAIDLMRTIFGVIGTDQSIQLRRGYSWGANNWSAYTDRYRTTPYNWDDNLWGAWVSLSDVESVLKS